MTELSREYNMNRRAKYLVTYAISKNDVLHPYHGDSFLHQWNTKKLSEKEIEHFNAEVRYRIAHKLAKHILENLGDVQDIGVTNGLRPDIHFGYSFYMIPQKDVEKWEESIIKKY